MSSSECLSAFLQCPHCDLHCFTAPRSFTHPLVGKQNRNAPFLVRWIFALVNIDRSPVSDMYPHHNQPRRPTLQSNQVIHKQSKWQTNQWMLIVETLSPLWFNYLLWWGRAARQGGRQAGPTTLWLMGPGPRKWVIQTERRGGRKRRGGWMGEKRKKKEKKKNRRKNERKGDEMGR